jgi:hypothetical protein
MKSTVIQISSLFALTACSGGSTSSGCARSLSTLSGDAPLPGAGVVPAGGYVAFADRGCTSTFTLQSIDASRIRLDAFTASHCSRDDKAENEAVSISMYIPSASGRGGGYLKNIPARDEFYERRKEFVDSVRALNNPRAAYIAEAISKIPSFGTWWAFEVPTGAPPTAAQDNTNRNLCLLKAKIDDTYKDASFNHCWSVFDTGVRSLEIRKADVGDKKFAIISKHLQAKAQEQKKLFETNRQLKEKYDDWSAKINGRMGGFRLLNYVKLAAFSNSEICGKYLPDNSPDKAACSVRQKLIELGSKYLVEIDTDGKRKSVFDKAKELGLAIDAPIPVQEYYVPFEIKEFQDDMEQRADVQFLDKYNSTIAEVSKLLPVSNNVFSKPSDNFLIATNLSRAAKRTQEFGLATFSSIGLSTQGVGAQGLSQFAGILKLYFKQSQPQVSFSKGDSGSMITIGGIVPLLALNTVNQEPTSGGASILALPEASEEADSPRGSLSVCK